MKKFLFNLILLIVLITVSGFVRADSPTTTPVPIITQLPLIGNQPVPGQTCGNINGQCCYVNPINVAIPSSNGLIEGPIIALVNSAIEQILKPIFAPLNQMEQNIVQPCVDGTPSTPGDTGNTSCKCVQSTTPSLSELSALCNGVGSGNRGPAMGVCKAGAYILELGVFQLRFKVSSKIPY